MEENNARIEFLVGRLLSGELSPSEELELNTWYAGHQDETIVVPEEFALSEQQLKSRILASVNAEIAVRPVRRLWPRIGVAAAMVLLMLSIGFYFFGDVVPKGDLVVQDIAPGRKGATLTLADGKRILLSEVLDGKVASESGVVITKTAEGELVYEVTGIGGDDLDRVNTLSTGNGETQQIRLQDGTIVYLNAASSLTYPASFAGASARRVSLTGEGYFEVARDAAKPFVVQSRGQELEVLGTHFNINTYADEPVVRTALLEGSVRLSGKGFSQLLKPGQEAVRTGSSVVVEPADEEEVLAWKNDRFVFNDEPLESIMRKVARWYDVEVVYEGVDKSEAFGGSLNRYSKVSQVLKRLGATNRVAFRIEGRKIYVLPYKPID